MHGKLALPNTRSKIWRRSMAVVSSTIGKRAITKAKALQPAKKKTLLKMATAYTTMKSLKERAGLVSQKTLGEHARILIKSIASLHVNISSIAAKKYHELQEFVAIDDAVKALQVIHMDKWSICENKEEQLARRVKHAAVLAELGLAPSDTVVSIARRLEKLCTKIMQVM
jgi:uncharacterized membrane protein YheB (UPF0754 family)